jgi:long-chain fatty acid transport protein
LDTIVATDLKEVGVKKIALVALFVCLLFGQAPFSRGAGFLIYEHGAAAMAMAGAFVSLANDPSAIFHNPAGIAFLNGTQMALGTTLIWSKASVDLPNWPVPSQKSWDQISQTFYPSNFYLTHNFGKVALGFGFFSPYGLGAKWPMENEQGGFPLRYLGYEDDMKTFFFNPTIAFKASENFSVGVGVSYIYSTVKFRLVQIADFTSYGAGKYDVPASLEGNGDAFGFNAGLLYRGKNFGFGLNYRSGFTIDFKGDMTLDPSKVPSFLQPYIPTTAKGETSFRFPHILGVGISFNLTEKFLLSADAHYVLWSRFDKYVVEFTEQDRGVPIEALEIEEKFEDAWTLRGGIQYSFSPQFALRAGVLYDYTPQPIETMDPLLPDANRLALTIGFGYKLGKSVVLDLAYQYEMFEDRTAPNRDIYPLKLGVGAYKTHADLLGVNLSFLF